MRRAATPIEITTDGVGRLRRLALTESVFAESWLQQLIHENPSLLPVDDLRPTIGELMSLGREIPTRAGPIDNLFVDSNGTVVIVETKLWRNPEARREVVGQIIDYAAALARLGFDEFDQAVRVANGDRGIVDLVGNGVDSPGRFTDGVARSLRTGDLLLLIVGDGIRESVEGIADLLAGAPHLGFTFGLIEIAAYESSSGARIVMPSVVAHSVEITRATVRVEMQTDGRVDVQVAALPDDRNGGEASRTKLDARAFDELLRESVDPATFAEFLEWRDLIDRDPRMRVDYGVASVIFRIKPIGISREFTGLVIKPTGDAAVGFLHAQMEKVGAPTDIASRFAMETADIVGASRPQRYPDTWGDLTGGANWADLADVLNQRAAFTDRMHQVADELELALGGG